MQRDEDPLVEQLTRLGVEDPHGTARSEVTEDIPQVAYARLERLVRTNLLSRRQTSTTGGPAFSVSVLVAHGHERRQWLRWSRSALTPGSRWKNSRSWWTTLRPRLFRASHTCSTTTGTTNLGIQPTCRRGPCARSVRKRTVPHSLAAGWVDCMSSSGQRSSDRPCGQSLADQASPVAPAPGTRRCDAGSLHRPCLRIGVSARFVEAFHSRQ